MFLSLINVSLSLSLSKINKHVFLKNFKILTFMKIFFIFILG